MKSKMSHGISSSDSIGSIDKIKDVYLAPGDWEVHFYDKVKEQHEKVRLAIGIQSVITTEEILIKLGYSFDNIDKIYRTR